MAHPYTQLPLDDISRKLPAHLDRGHNQAKTPKTRPLQVRLQERDFFILERLWAYRILSTTLLHFLVNARFPLSYRALCRRLHMLFKTSFIDRPNPYDQVYLKVVGLESNILHALGREGYKALAPRLGLPVDNYQARRQTTKNAEIKAAALYHDLQLSRCRATIELALYKHRRVRLLLWKRSNLEARVPLPPAQLKFFTGRPDKTITMIPDSLFIVKHITVPAPNTAAYFVEYDNGTTPLVSRWLLRKGLAYAAYHDQDGQSEQHGFSSFRILVVTPTMRRAHNILEALNKWLKWAATQGTVFQRDLWWLTSRDMYSPEQPQTILRKIWITVDGKKHSLLD